MNDTDILAIAAHLHVLLRRKTGRVTDTEWMACNPQYAREIARFAHQHAQTDHLPELAEWAQRLEQAVSQVTNMVAVAPLLDSQTGPVGSVAPPPAPPPRYVGGIR